MGAGREENNNDDDGKKKKKKRMNRWDVPGSPVVKTWPSSADDVGFNLDWGAKIPHALWSERQNIKQK